MSTDTSILIDLQNADEQVKTLEQKLPWYKRFNRRYLTGSAFTAWQISSLFTWVKAVFTMKFLFGGKNLAMALSTKYPVAYNIGTAVWGKVLLVCAAAVEVVHETFV